MMVAKQKHVPFPVHFLDTVQLLTGTSQRVQSPIDGLHTATCASPAMDKMQKLHSGHQDQRLCHVLADMLSNKLGIFQFFLQISQMWETLGDHEFLVLQCPVCF